MSPLDKFREASNAEPFQPFTMTLADGRLIRIAAREYFGESLGRARRKKVLYSPDLDTRDLIPLDPREIADVSIG